MTKTNIQLGPSSVSVHITEDDEVIDSMCYADPSYNFARMSDDEIVSFINDRLNESTVTESDL